MKSDYNSLNDVNNMPRPVSNSNFGDFDSSDSARNNIGESIYPTEDEMRSGGSGGE